MTKILAKNKKAYFDYEILERFEAGIVLQGTEVKSIRTGGVSLKGSYVVIRKGEVFWVGAHIPAYQPANAPSDYNPERPRKLLLRKSEIKGLIGKSQQKGLTLVPLRVYTKNGVIKLEFGLGKGKKKKDQRKKIKKREAERKMRRALKRGR